MVKKKAEKGPSMFLTANPTNFEAEKVRSETRIRLNLHLDDGPLLSL